MTGGATTPWRTQRRPNTDESLIRHVRSALSILGGALLLLALPAEDAAAQDPPEEPPAQEADTTELVFEREVFRYPEYQRRNPFRALTSAESGPRFEDLRLLGVILTGDPAENVALLGVGTPPSGAGGNYQTHRVRAGMTLGNVRIVEIRRNDVVVDVEDFGQMDRRRLELRRPDGTDRPEQEQEPTTDDTDGEASDYDDGGSGEGSNGGGGSR